MPFVMMCGLPSCGKTFYTDKLAEYFRSQNKNVIIVNEHPFMNDKNSVYLDSSHEKELRGNLKSEVQKFMSKDDVVILDYLNYIKGYRYELFCISKLYQTPQCVIFPNLTLEECQNMNKKKHPDEQYSDEVLKALNMRFEPPESKNRWDSTLYVINNGQDLPLEEIADTLFNKQAPPPNKSTLNKPLSDTTLLHDIDKSTQEILTHILSLQNNQLASNEVSVPGASEKVKLIRPVNLAELRRWRQQFLTYIKMHPPSDASKVSNMFVEYINNLIL